MTEAQSGGGRRETRLLLATIAVSVGMLLLLARFRFPEEAGRSAAEPAPAPLERLAARATYDELAGIMADLERRVLPTTGVLALQGDAGTSYAPAVRMAPSRAIAVLPRERRLATLESLKAPPIIARDAVRELVVVQVEASPAVVTTLGVAPRPGPRYLAVVDATAQGPAIRPVYVGRTGLFADPRWSSPVFSVTAAQQSLAPGSAVFSLDGVFIGLVSDTAGAATIIPAESLRSLVDAAPSAPLSQGDLDVEVQPLTALLSRAAGAQKGVMVTYVPPAVAESTSLMSGDVIESVDGINVTTVAGFQQVAQSRTPGTGVTLAVWRRGKALTVTMMAIEAGGSSARLADGDLGAVLRTVDGAGTEIVAVQPGTTAARAGLRRGDLVVALDGSASPRSADVQRAFRTAESKQVMMLTVRREGEHRVIALEKP